MIENHQKQWTPELDSKLEEMVSSNRTYRTIAKALGRSQEAIERRIVRLGIEDKHLATGTLSAKALAEIVGVDPSTVIKYWIKENGLPAQQKSFRGDKNKKHKPYYIFPEDFWEWAESRKKYIQFSKIERGILLPEPDWLEEELKFEFHHPLAKQRKIWTDEEDDQLWHMYYTKGMLQKEIAQQLKRTKSSVEKRLKRLRIKRL